MLIGDKATGVIFGEKIATGIKGEIIVLETEVFIFNTEEDRCRGEWRSPRDNPYFKLDFKIEDSPMTKEDWISLFWGYYHIYTYFCCTVFFYANGGSTLVSSVWKKESSII